MPKLGNLYAMLRLPPTQKVVQTQCIWRSRSWQTSSHVLPFLLLQSSTFRTECALELKLTTVHYPRSPKNGPCLPPSLLLHFSFISSKFRSHESSNFLCNTESRCLCLKCCAPAPCVSSSTTHSPNRCIPPLKLDACFRMSNT
jgi:hypothetical protein